jgi:hypothetical protein
VDVERRSGVVCMMQGCQSRCAMQGGPKKRLGELPDMLPVCVGRQSGSRCVEADHARKMRRHVRAQNGLSLPFAKSEALSMAPTHQGNGGSLTLVVLVDGRPFAREVPMDSLA